MKKDVPRDIALFPISVVKEMTNLTARQIRYYEEQGLIKPARNDGNQRLFSLNDIDCFLEIKSLIDKGVNIAGIKAVFDSKIQQTSFLPSQDEKAEIAKDWEDLVQIARQKYNDYPSKEK
ncbi:MerR family transcriptional regulator [Alkalihalobacillus sp. LMS39]|uniref:MerR family transcriptional regulator n=1 Tax=Alkalihalobacillus sp. LMS39 TaxID=2924032 RepID=UPI001FB1B609|nr:MerR family transcriptional regulator [Alkalihalobacillus sp. LMS39]UOE94005.1 MerR family transcriptional regulator [Alkalihalobacillus sp. LMS39]